MALAQTVPPSHQKTSGLEVEEPIRPDPLDLLGTEPVPKDLLPYLVEFVEEQRAKNQDIYIAVSGREGKGKSSLGLTAAIELKKDLSPGEIILDRDDYYRVYDPDAKDEVYVFDEANRLLFNREWNDRHQRGLVQEVMENRKNRNVYFLHTPQVKTLDKYMREGRIDLWFACKAQGEAMVRKLDYNVYEEEAYYPIIIDDHFWAPLERSYPEFAEAYYARKDQAHSDAFHERKRENFARDKKESVDDEHGGALSEDIRAEANSG